MPEDPTTPPAQADPPASGEDDPNSLDDLLQELRIILQGAQVLTAFLIVLPFNAGFDKIHEFEKWVYLATFICAITSLILFTAPAANHRLLRPLMDRVQFKDYATRMIIIGLVFLSFALILVSQLVVTQVVGESWALGVATLVGVIIGIVWWVLPLWQRMQSRE